MIVIAMTAILDDIYGGNSILKENFVILYEILPETYRTRRIRLPRDLPKTPNHVPACTHLLCLSVHLSVRPSVSPSVTPADSGFNKLVGRWPIRPGRPRPEPDVLKTWL